MAAGLAPDAAKVKMARAGVAMERTDKPRLAASRDEWMCDGLFMVCFFKGDVTDSLSANTTEWCQSGNQG